MTTTPSFLSNSASAKPGSPPAPQLVQIRDLVYQVADILTEQRVPFIFVTGYDADNVDGRFRNVPILQKPVEQEALRKLLCKQPDLAKAVGE